MGAKSSASDEEIISEINVTPLVDIVLVLLIIFMVAAPIINRPNLPLELPKAASAEESKLPLLSVVISKDKEIYLNGKLSNKADIKKAAEEVKAKLPKGKSPTAFVSADTRSNYGTFAEVVDELRLSGVFQIALDTKPQKLDDIKEVEATE